MLRKEASALRQSRIHPCHPRPRSCRQQPHPRGRPNRRSVSHRHHHPCDRRSTFRRPFLPARCCHRQAPSCHLSEHQSFQRRRETVTTLPRQRQNSDRCARGWPCNQRIREVGATPSCYSTNACPKVSTMPRHFVTAEAEAGRRRRWPSAPGADVCGDESCRASDKVHGPNTPRALAGESSHDRV
jgi:hypothetical protein